MTHYIAMAGLHGCLPNYCASFETHNDAADSLASVHSLGRKRALVLRRDGYLELNLHRDGNEYAEVEACECTQQEDHNDA